MKYRGDHIRVSDLEIGDFIFVKRTLSDYEVIVMNTMYCMQ